MDRFCCILCGDYIRKIDGSDEHLWLREFRAVYSSPTGIYISGTGRYRNTRSGAFLAPSHYGKRWKDRHNYSVEIVQISVLGQSPNDGRYGYIMHDACWCLLEESFAPAAVPIDRFYDICRSLPQPLLAGCVYWGHDYGGNLSFDENGPFPWDYQVLRPHCEYRTYPHFTIENPYVVPEVCKLLSSPSQSPPGFAVQGFGKDLFAIFPWEIREEIAASMLTEDVLKLRLASRAFVMIFSSQKFWASRFVGNGECAFLYEAHRNKKLRDWRTLFRLTKNDIPPGLENRRKIWPSLRSIGDLLKSRPAICSSDTQSVQLLEDLDWTEVAGDLRSVALNRRHFETGCCLFGRQRAFVPKRLREVIITMSGAGSHVYIAGLRFIADVGEEINLGYTACGKKFSHKAVGLFGFVLAVGSGGIQAMQIIDGDNCRSDWLGYPGKSPITERLAPFGLIDAISVGFDGFKLVSLETAVSGSTYIEKLDQQEHSIRSTALWYPAVPDLALCLNDQSFTGESPSTAGYQPLFWTKFGGPKGSYLQHLEGIAIVGSYIDGIAFYYDDKLPIKSCTLGHFAASTDSNFTFFPIDGPGGEYITSVECSLVLLDGERARRWVERWYVDTLRVSCAYFDQGNRASCPSVSDI